MRSIYYYQGINLLMRRLILYICMCLHVFRFFFLLFKIDIHFKKYSYITIKSIINYLDCTRVIHKIKNLLTSSFSSLKPTVGGLVGGWRSSQTSVCFPKEGKSDFNYMYLARSLPSLRFFDKRCIIQLPWLIIKVVRQR